MPALVSIAVPVFNTSRFLPAALDSVLAQDHPHWECLVWDDGSTDGSRAVAEGYAARDPRFRVLGDGRNRGVSASCAGALSQAQGEYVAILDSDDMLEPDALSSMLSFMHANPRLGMGYSEYVEVAEDGTYLAPGRRFLRPYSAHNLLVDFITYQFRLIRAEAYRAVGGVDAGMPVAYDYDLCLRLSERVEVGHLQKPLYRYRMRDESISHASRLRQVRASFDAAQRALQRRGLQGKYALALGVRARHVLKPKDASLPTGDGT